MVKYLCKKADDLNNSNRLERHARRKSMRIYAQNMVRNNGQETFHQFLPKAARLADAQKASKHRELKERAAALTRGGGIGRLDTGLENTGVAALSSFLVDKKEVPAKAAQKIEEYYQATGSLADTITYKETRLKYLQSEYEKIAAKDSGKRGEKMKELMKAEYKDMAGVLNYTADLMSESLRNSETVFGKPFSEEYRALLKDVPDKIHSIADGLKESDSVEEALEYLGAAKGQLAELAKELKNQYQTYTGKELAGYEYRTEEDYAGAVGSYGLMWSWEEVTVDTEHMENLADYGVDIHNLGAIPAAVNLIDTKA